MRTGKGWIVSLSGSSYEIGRKQGEAARQNSDGWRGYFLEEPMPEGTYKELIRLLNTYCPGIVEEVQGFCDELQMSPRHSLFYNTTYLKAGCSHCAVFPARTSEKHTLVLRSYELSPETDDWRLCSTAAGGAYQHCGFSAILFGRIEGMNEHGLCVTFSACGLPVGHIPGMRRPQVSGLQFWIVVRALLEQCKDTAEALALAREMPIASNMNLIVADRAGTGALIETYEGKMEVVETDGEKLSFLAGTNHALLPPLDAIEQKKMNHSLVRYNLINQFFQQHGVITKDQLKGLAEKEYPDGLSAHFYPEYFGTLHSILFDSTDGTMDVCFGSPLINPWYSIKVGEPLPVGEVSYQIEDHPCPSDFMDWV